MPETAIPDWAQESASQVPDWAQPSTPDWAKEDPQSVVVGLRQSQLDEMVKRSHGGQRISPWGDVPGQPQTELTQALYQELPATIGKGLETAGKVIYEGGVNAIANTIAEFQPPSAGEGAATLSTEKAIREYPAPVQAGIKGVAGVTESLPKMAIYAADPGLGILAFGSTPEGFDPKQAAIAAVLPVIGKYTGAITEAIAAKLGVPNETALLAFNKIGGATGAASLIAADEWARIRRLPQEEQSQAIIDAAGNVGAMFLLGTMGEAKRSGLVEATENLRSGDIAKLAPNTAAVLRSSLPPRPSIETLPELQRTAELVDQALAESQQKIVIPGRTAAIDLLKAQGIEITPATIKLAERNISPGETFPGMSVEGVQVQPKALRSAEDILLERDKAQREQSTTTDAEKEMLQRFVDEEATKGAVFSNETLPNGVYYRRPSRAPTQEEYQKRVAKESVERGLSQESGYYLDEPRNQPLPEPTPKPERKREGVTIVSPGIGQAIEKPIPLSALQKSRLRVALQKGASEQTILNILRLKEREPAQPQKRKPSPNAIQVQEPNAGVLRSEGPQVGLPQVGTRNAEPEITSTTQTEAALQEAQAQVQRNDVAPGNEVASVLSPPENRVKTGETEGGGAGKVGGVKTTPEYGLPYGLSEEAIAQAGGIKEAIDVAADRINSEAKLERASDVYSWNTANKRWGSVWSDVKQDPTTRLWRVIAGMEGNMRGLDVAEFNTEEAARKFSKDFRDGKTFAAINGDRWQKMVASAHEAKKLTPDEWGLLISRGRKEGTLPSGSSVKSADLISLYEQSPTTPPATSAGVETKQSNETTNLRQPSTQSQGPGTTAGEKPTTQVVGEQKPPPLPVKPGGGLSTRTAEETPFQKQTRLRELQKKADAGTLPESERAEFEKRNAESQALSKAAAEKLQQELEAAGKPAKPPPSPAGAGESRKASELTLTDRERELLTAISKWKRSAGESSRIYPNAEDIGATRKEWLSLTRKGWMDKAWPGVLSMKARMALDNPFAKPTPPPSEPPSGVDKAIKSIEDLQKKIRGSGSNLGMNVPVALLDTALEVARLTLKAGKSITEAIDAAIEHIRKNASFEVKKTFDEQEVRAKLSAALNPTVKSPEPTLSDLSPEGFKVLGRGLFETSGPLPAGAKVVSKFVVDGKTTYHFRLPPKVIGEAVVNPPPKPSEQKTETKPPIRVEGEELNTRKSAARAVNSDQFPESVRQQIAASPESEYKIQPQKDVLAMVESMSEAELRAIPKESNIYVAGNLKLSKLLFDQGRYDEGYEVFQALSKVGTDFGQNINQFKMLKGVTPFDIVKVVNLGLKKSGRDPLTKPQEEKLATLSNESINRGEAVSRAKNDWMKDPTDLNAKLADDAVEAAHQADLELQRMVSRFTPKSWPRMLKAMVQGNLLTPSSQIANIVGNTVGATMEAGSRNYGAFLNMIRSMLTGKERTLTVSPFLGPEAAATAFGRTLKQSAEIMRRGSGQSVKGETRQNLQPLVSLKNALAKNPEGPTVGGKVPFNERARMAVEGVFGIAPEVMLRMLSAADRPSYEAARARLINEQLKLAKMPGTVRSMALKYPEMFFTPEVMKRIEAESADAVFQRKSKSVSTLEGLIKHYGGDWADLAFTVLVSPYRLTPWNLIGRTLLYNPLVSLYQIAKYTKAGNTRLADLNAGRFVVGTLLYGAGYFLYKNGLIGPSLDSRDETQKERLLAGQVLPPNHINLSGLNRLVHGGNPKFQPGDETIDMTRGGGAAGAILSSVANIGRDMEKKPEGNNDLIITLLQNSTLEQSSFTINQSFLKGVTGILDAIRDRNFDPYIRGVESVMMSVAAPNTLTTLSRATRKYAPDMKGDTALKDLENLARDRFGVFGADDYLPLKRDLWGQPIKQTPEGRNALLYHLFDISKNQQVTSDPVALELYDLWRKTASREVVPSLPTRQITIKDKTHPLTQELYSDYAEQVGKRRREIIERIVTNPKYQNLNDENKIKILSRVWDAGMEQGKMKFLQQHPISTLPEPKQHKAGFKP